MLAACGQGFFGVADELQGCAGIAADRFAFGFYGVQPGQKLSRCRAAARVHAGRAHALGHLFLVFGPPGDERGMREDRRAQHRVSASPAACSAWT